MRRSLLSGMDDRGAPAALLSNDFGISLRRIFKLEIVAVLLYNSPYFFEKSSTLLAHRKFSYYLHHNVLSNCFRIALVYFPRNGEFEICINFLLQRVHVLFVFLVVIRPFEM